MTYKILIIEDQEDQRRIMKLWFEHCTHGDFHILEAANSVEGEVLLRTEMPDCVITDRYLGRNDDGYPFIHEMLKYANCPPLILVTCAWDNDLRKQCLALGAAECFNKMKLEPNQFCLAVIGIITEWRTTKNKYCEAMHSNNLRV